MEHFAACVQVVMLVLNLQPALISGFIVKTSTQSHNILPQNVSAPSPARKDETDQITSPVQMQDLTVRDVHGDDTAGWKILYPTVRVSVISSDGHKNSIQVPLAADMSVLAAFIAATRTYIRQNGMATNIPYNLLLYWDHSLKCFAVDKDMDTGSPAGLWYITIFSRSHKMLYHGRCLPEHMYLRASQSVQVSFKHGSPDATPTPRLSQTPDVP